jgi:hypothetical protein
MRRTNKSHITTSVTVDVVTSGYVHQGRDADLVGDGRMVSRVADAVVLARICGSCCKMRADGT